MLELLKVATFWGYLKKGNSQEPWNPRTPGASTSCLHMSFADSNAPPSPWPIHLLPSPLCTVNVNSFRPTYIFLSRTWCIESLKKLQMRDMFFSLAMLLGVKTPCSKMGLLFFFFFFASNGLINFLLIKSLSSVEVKISV